jgi:radical SAM superfamily enzyme YgiQ (UPF0313 family)
MAGGLGYSAGPGVVLPPLDLLNIVTTLKTKGHHVDFVDAVAEKVGVKKIFKKIKKNNIEVVIGNLSVPTIDEDIEFYKLLRKKFKKLKILAKTGINFEQILKLVMESTLIDGIIFTEVDLNIEEYIDEKNHNGMAYWSGKKVEISKDVTKRLDNLDVLPIPERQAGKLELYRYGLIPGKITTIQTSRGCPYPCGYYCPYPMVQGKMWRKMSPERVVKEIKSIVKLGINNILFRDATFTLDMPRAEKICQLIVKSKIKINWWCETRINVLNEELLRSMKKSGCKGINVGVETMDEKLILSEGKPGVSLKDVIRIRMAAKKIGIKLHFLMIVGLPNDNVEGLFTTFKYLVKLHPESAGFSLITPYPGTPMFDQAIKEHLIESFNWNDFRGDVSNMRTKYMSRKELELGRFLLMVSEYLIKKGGYIEKFGLSIIKIIFVIWSKIKRKY